MNQIFAGVVVATFVSCDTRTWSMPWSTSTSVAASTQFWRVSARLLSGAARAFGSANPSKFAALVQGALTAAGRTWVGGDERGATLGVLDQAIASIKKRGKAELGDKTVLDPLQASRDVRAAAARLDAGTLREVAAAAERTDL